jgi:hypothetical protein
LTLTRPDGMMPPREGPPMERYRVRLSHREFVGRRTYQRSTI